MKCQMIWYKNMEDVDTSLDDDLGIGALKIPSMEKAMKGVNQKLRRSDREKKIVKRFGYSLLRTILESRMAATSYSVPSETLTGGGGDVRRPGIELVVYGSKSETWKIG